MVVQRAESRGHGAAGEREIKGTGIIAWMNYLEDYVPHTERSANIVYARPNWLLPVPTACSTHHSAFTRAQARAVVAAGFNEATF